MREMALSLMPQAFKKSGGYIPSFILSVAQTLFSLFFFFFFFQKSQLPLSGLSTW